jgi:hypothetical protein
VCWLRFETRTSQIQVTIVTFTLTYSVHPSVNFCSLGQTFPVEVSPQNVCHFPAVGELQVNALQDTASEYEYVPFIARSDLLHLLSGGFSTMQLHSLVSGLCGGLVLELRYTCQVEKVLAPHCVSSPFLKQPISKACLTFNF